MLWSSACCEYSNSPRSTLDLIRSTRLPLCVLTFRVSQAPYVAEAALLESLGLEVDYLPEHLIGGGGSHIGLEFAQMSGEARSLTLPSTTFEIVGANLFDDDRRSVSERITACGLCIDPPPGRAGMTEREPRVRAARARVDCPSTCRRDGARS